MLGSALFDRLTGRLRPLALPLGAALMVLGVTRLLLSAIGGCADLSCDDFGRFWYSTSAWRSSGASLYAATPASIADDGLFYSNLNLPHTHLLFLPFTWMPRDFSFTVWTLAGVASVVVSAGVVASETGWRPSWPWFILFVWWMPTHVQVVTGQIAWILLLPVTFAWRAARRGHWARAGLLIGIAVAIKPFLAPLVGWLLWRRQARAALGAVATVLLVTAAGLAVFGAAAYAEWQVVTRAVDWYPRAPNASLWGIAYRWFSYSQGFVPVFPSALGLALALVLGCVGVATLWYRVARTGNLDAEWSMTVAASLWLSPLGWVYYGVLLLPGLNFRFPGVAATICWLLPTPMLLAGQPSALATALWGSAASWGLLLAMTHIVSTSESIRIAESE